MMLYLSWHCSDLAILSTEITNILEKHLPAQHPRGEDKESEETHDKYGTYNNKYKTNRRNNRCNKRCNNRRNNDQQLLILHSQQIWVMQRRQQIKQQYDNNSTNTNVYKTLRRLRQNLQHHHQDKLQKLADKHQEE